MLILGLYERKKTKKSTQRATCCSWQRWQLCRGDFLKYFSFSLSKELKRKTHCMLFFLEIELYTCIGAYRKCTYFISTEIRQNGQGKYHKTTCNGVSVGGLQIRRVLHVSFLKTCLPFILFLDFIVTLIYHQILNKYTTDLKSYPDLILLTTCHYCVCLSGTQRAALWIWVSPSTLTLVPGVELSFSGL